MAILSAFLGRQSPNYQTLAPESRNFNDDVFTLAINSIGAGMPTLIDSTARGKEIRVANIEIQTNSSDLLQAMSNDDRSGEGWDVRQGDAEPDSDEEPGTASASGEQPAGLPARRLLDGISPPSRPSQPDGS